MVEDASAERSLLGLAAVGPADDRVVALEAMFAAFQASHPSLELGGASQTECACLAVRDARSRDELSTGRPESQLAVVVAGRWRDRIAVLAARDAQHRCQRQGQRAPGAAANPRAAHVKALRWRG